MRLSQKDFGTLMGLTSRQVRNLTDQGMPSEVDGRFRYYGPEAVAWYLEMKLREEREKHASGEREKLELEKLRHQAREAKVRADLAESRVVSVDEAAAQWDEAVGILRSITLRIPVRYADVVRPDDPAAGEESLEEVADDLLGSYQEALAPPDLVGPKEVTDAA